MAFLIYDNAKIRKLPQNAPPFRKNISPLHRDILPFSSHKELTKRLHPCRAISHD